MAFLGCEQRTAVYEQLKDFLPGLIRSARDFQNVVRYLAREQRTAVYEQLKDFLPGFIMSATDFHYVMAYLMPEQRTAVYGQLKDFLPGIIKSATDYRDVLCYLVPEQRTAVCEEIEEQLPEFIEDRRDFSKILDYLTSEQIRRVCKGTKKRRPEIMKNAEEVAEVLGSRALNREQRTAVYESFKEDLSKLIKNATDFKDVVYYLAREQRTAVYVSLKEDPSKLIKNATDFKDVVYYLAREHKTAVYESLKENLPEFIKSATDFHYVMVYLMPEQRTAVCKELKGSSFSEFIRSAGDVKSILVDLNREQRTVIYENLKSSFPRFIKSAADFKAVVCYLTPEQRMAVYESLREFLPERIKSAEELRSIIKELLQDKKNDPHYLRKLYKLNDGGWLATLRIFGFFNESDLNKVRAIMTNRAQKNVNGASAKTLDAIAMRTKVPENFPEKTRMECLVLGGVGCGKTSLIKAFIYGKFTKQYDVTIGWSFFKKAIVVDKHEVALTIFETNYGALFRESRLYGDRFYKRANIILFCIDVCFHDSLDWMDSWYNNIKKYLQRPVIVLVGIDKYAKDSNDLYLRQNDQVQDGGDITLSGRERRFFCEDGENFVTQHGFAGYIECCSESSINVAEPFEKTTRKVIENLLSGELDLERDGEGYVDGKGRGISLNHSLFSLVQEKKNEREQKPSMHRITSTK